MAQEVGSRSLRSLDPTSCLPRTLPSKCFAWCYGPELTSRHFLAWAIENKIDILHIRPGKPTENAYVESFHGRLRDECLNVSWFWNLFDARKKISAWQLDYNSQRPHSSLGYRTPEEFAQQWLLARRSQNLHKGETEGKITL